jgi:hypothetical protein
MAARRHRRFSQVVAGSAAGLRLMDRWQDKSREVRARSARVNRRKFNSLARGAQVAASLRFQRSGCLTSGNRTSRGGARA